MTHAHTNTRTHTHTHTHTHTETSASYVYRKVFQSRFTTFENKTPPKTSTKRRRGEQERKTKQNRATCRRGVVVTRWFVELPCNPETAVSVGSILLPLPPPSPSSPPHPRFKTGSGTCLGLPSPIWSLTPPLPGWSLVQDVDFVLINTFVVVVIWYR